MTSTAQTQRERILARLIEAGGLEVPSPELARISLQYNARIFEARRMGFKIISRTQTVNGQKHGFYRLAAKGGVQ